MGEPLRHIPVKLIAGLISSKPSGFYAAKPFLEKKFGRIDNESDTFTFSCTSYYEMEFGRDLKRKFFSFKKLAWLNGSYRVKLYTNSVERKLSEKNSRTIDPERSRRLPHRTNNPSAALRIDGEQGSRRLPRRTTNIDPGYISPAKLVLFTTKNRNHRIYIDGGIYAEPELQFIKKSFRAFPWTYPDYRSADYIDFFNSVRSDYLEQVKNYLVRKAHAY